MISTIVAAGTNIVLNYFGILKFGYMAAAYNDMFARYEQTMLMVKTLEHFGHNDSVYLEVLNGKHCEHTCKVDEDGDGVLGKIINAFIEKLN